MLDEMGRLGTAPKPEHKPPSHEEMLAEFNMIHSVASQPLQATDINIKAAVTSSKKAFNDD
jgi:hypothetical protein